MHLAILVFIKISKATSEVDDGHIMDGLEVDNVCQPGNNDCSVEMLQVRAKTQVEAAEATYGFDAQEDNLLEITPKANSSTCETDTYGTCSLRGCDSSRGATKCVGGKCLCADGYCAKG